MHLKCVGFYYQNIKKIPISVNIVWMLYYENTHGTYGPRLKKTWICSMPITKKQAACVSVQSDQCLVTHSLEIIIETLVSCKISVF